MLMSLGSISAFRFQWVLLSVDFSCSNGRLIKALNEPQSTWAGAVKCVGLSRCTCTKTLAFFSSFLSLFKKPDGGMGVYATPVSIHNNVHSSSLCGSSNELVWVVIVSW